MTVSFSPHPAFYGAVTTHRFKHVKGPEVRSRNNYSIDKLMNTTNDDNIGSMPGVKFIRGDIITIPFITLYM